MAQGTLPDAARQFLDRILTLTRGRDGQAHMLSQEALEESMAAEEPAGPDRPATQGSRRQRLALEPQHILRESLAAKALHGWLQNRHQTLVPMTFNLAAMDERSRGLLVHVMALAAAADGETDAADQQRMRAALEGAGGGEAERRLLAEAIAAPRMLGRLLQEVQEARLGSHAYAASLLALDPRSRVNRAWLDYLAARLGLPAEVVTGLNRRYRGRRVTPAPR